jgi:tRNA dimethylallyltransferase
LLQSSKIPIIVGGTNYWIEALLWKNLVSPGVGVKRKNSNDFATELEGFSKEIKNFYNHADFPDSMLEMESTQLFEHLKIIDPQSANKLHPNNKRKIMR